MMKINVIFPVVCVLRRFEQKRDRKSSFSWHGHAGGYLPVSPKGGSTAQSHPQQTGPACLPDCCPPGVHVGGHLMDQTVAGMKLAFWFTKCFITVTFLFQRMEWKIASKIIKTCWLACSIWHMTMNTFLEVTPCVCCCCVGRSHDLSSHFGPLSLHLHSFQVNGTIKAAMQNATDDTIYMHILHVVQLHHSPSFWRKRYTTVPVTATIFTVAGAWGINEISKIYNKSTSFCLGLLGKVSSTYIFLVVHCGLMKWHGDTSLWLFISHISGLEDKHRHRFSAFWLRSKCSICSYQLNIWYDPQWGSLILNWFLNLGEDTGACSDFPTGWPGIAVPPGSAHSL